MNINDRTIIAVDGPNCGGKSTIIQQLKLLFPWATVVENHDYFHVNTIRISGKNIWKNEHWKELKNSTREKALDYIIERDNATVRYIHSLTLDDIILERFMLTGMVYSKLLRFDMSIYKKHMDKIIPEMNDLVFIYAACEDECLLQRVNHGNLKQQIRKKSRTPYHLLDEKSIINKNYLYNEYFHNLTFKNKILLNTSRLSEKEISQKLSDLLKGSYDYLHRNRSNA